MKKLVLLMWLLCIVWSLPGQHCQAGIIGGIERRNSPHTAPVVADSMEEGALSYVDRSHRYRDIPYALIGTEYIKVANDDKRTQFHELDVTLSQAATVYLLLDHRLGNGVTTGQSGQYMEPNCDSAGMYWVEDGGFVDTGWDIRIDQSAAGLIDQYASVFSRQAGPGTITLYQQDDATDNAHRTMYGVAVVPEPMSLVLLALGVAIMIPAHRAWRLK